MSSYKQPTGVLRSILRATGLSPFVMPLHPDLCRATKRTQEELKKIAFTENLLYVCLNTLQHHFVDLENHLHFVDEIQSVKLLNKKKKIRSRFD